MTVTIIICNTVLMLGVIAGLCFFLHKILENNAAERQFTLAERSFLVTFIKTGDPVQARETYNEVMGVRNPPEVVEVEEAVPGFIGDIPVMNKKVVG